MPVGKAELDQVELLQTPASTSCGQPRIFLSPADETENLFQGWRKAST